MYRSNKPAIKQEVKKKDVPEHILDEIRYLGTDLKTLEEEAKAIAEANKK